MECLGYIMTDWFNFRIQANTQVLRSKCLKASKRLKLFHYKLKPKFKPYLRIFPNTLTGRPVLHLTFDFTRRAKHLKWIFSTRDICSYNNLPLNPRYNLGAKATPSGRQRDR